MKPSPRKIRISPNSTTSVAVHVARGLQHDEDRVAVELELRAAGGRGWRPPPPARAARTRAAPTRTPPRWARAGRSRRTCRGRGSRRRRASSASRRPVLVHRAIDDHGGGILAQARHQRQRLVAVLHLARVHRRLQLAHQLAHLRAGLHAQLVAAQRQLRRAVRAPFQRGRHHVARQLEVRLDPGLLRLAAGGEPVGAREHGDLHLHRLAAAQVGVDRAAVERAVVHHEAEHQVLARELGDVGAQLLAGAQPAEDLGRPSPRPRRRGR